jgi:hypothetical protein
MSGTLSDETKQTIKTIFETAAHAVDATCDVTEMLVPFVPGAAAVPVVTLQGIVKAALLAGPALFEKAAAALGIDESVTVNIKDTDAKVTGEIHR